MQIHRYQTVATELIGQHHFSHRIVGIKGLAAHGKSRIAAQHRFQFRRIGQGNGQIADNTLRVIGKNVQATQIHQRNRVKLHTVAGHNTQFGRANIYRQTFIVGNVGRSDAFNRQIQIIRTAAAEIIHQIVAFTLTNHRIRRHLQYGRIPPPDRHAERYIQTKIIQINFSAVGKSLAPHYSGDVIDLPRYKARRRTENGIVLSGDDIAQGDTVVIMEDVLQYVAELEHRLLHRLHFNGLLNAGVQNRFGVQIACAVAAIAIGINAQFQLTTKKVFDDIILKKLIGKIGAGHVITRYRTQTVRQDVRRCAADNLKSDKIGTVVIGATVVQVLKSQRRLRRDRDRSGVTDDTRADLRPDARNRVGRLHLRTNRVGISVQKSGNQIVLAVAALYFKGDVAHSFQINLQIHALIGADGLVLRL